MSLGDADLVGSPAWWFKALAKDLQDRRSGRQGNKVWSRTTSTPTRVRPGLDLLWDHYTGDPPLLGVAEGWRDGFRETTRIGRLNVAGLLVEQKANRMPLRGFRTAAADDELGDVVAREVMRANKMKIRARDVHTGFLTLADSYAMVTPAGSNAPVSSTGKPIPTISAEDARECITYDDPVTGEEIAALKLYYDRVMEAEVGHLFIRQEDDRVLHRKAVRPTAASSLATGNAFRMANTWEWVAQRDYAEGEDEGSGDDPRIDDYVQDDRMPVYHFTNRDGAGEFERHLDTLDRINDQILNKLVIAKVQAFRQRAIKGLPDKQKKRVDGATIEVEIDYTDAFIAGPGELWKVPADTDFWESSAVDLNPLLTSIKDDLAQLAAVTSTPLYTITPDAADGSAEGASSMRESHVYAVEACRDQAEAKWPEVMADVFAFMGDTERANAALIEPIWGPVERYSIGEKANAAAQSAGSLPREAIQRDIFQYDPAEIPNLRAMQGRDFLTTGAPPVAGGPPAPTGVPALPTLTLGVPPLGVPGGAQPAAAS